VARCRVTNFTAAICCQLIPLHAMGYENDVTETVFVVIAIER